MGTALAFFLFYEGSNLFFAYGWQNGVLALRQEVNPHNNRIAQSERASGKNPLALFRKKTLVFCVHKGDSPLHT